MEKYWPARDITITGRRYFSDKPDGSVQNDERPLRTENFSPRLGVVYQPVSTVSIYLDYNEGFFSALQ